MKKIDDIKISDLLPEYLKSDIKLNALSKGVEDILEEWVNDIEKTILYKNIDTIPEELVILLMEEWSVDFVDEDTTLEQKRELLKNSFDSHSRRGCVDILEKSILTIFPDIRLSEWFEHGGDPATFKLIIEGDTPPADVVERIYKAVEYYKNTRSHLSGFIISTLENLELKYRGKLSNLGKNEYKAVIPKI